LKGALVKVLGSQRSNCLRLKADSPPGILFSPDKEGAAVSK
jgi:hypothetical protein